MENASTYFIAHSLRQSDIAQTHIPLNPAQETYEERELIRRCQAGEIPAFEALYHRYKSLLYSHAFRFHGNVHDAEDSLQELFITMFRKIRSFKQDARLSTWLYRILTNICITKSRQRSRTEQPFDMTNEHFHPGAFPGNSDAVLHDILQREIAKLPDLQKSVFLLFACDEFSHTEISHILSIREGTSKSYYHRAKETLKSRLVHRGIHLEEVQR
jgi:RNA polymerase sigma-70 factor (ECF subfamily)